MDRPDVAGPGVGRVGLRRPGHHRRPEVRQGDDPHRRRIAFNVDNLCDTFKGGAGIKDGITEGGTLTSFVSTPGWGNGYPLELAPNAPVKTVRHSLVDIYTAGMIAEGGIVSTVDPTVDCSVNTLPKPVQF